MFDIFNNAIFRLIGMILLLGVPSVLITLLIAKYEGHRRILKYLLPSMFIILSAACFVNGIFFDKTMGGLGYLVLGMILVVPGVAGIITAIFAGIHYRRQRFSKNAPNNLYKYK